MAGRGHKRNLQNTGKILFRDPSADFSRGYICGNFLNHISMMYRLFIGVLYFNKNFL